MFIKNVYKNYSSILYSILSRIVAGIISFGFTFYISNNFSIESVGIFFSAYAIFQITSILVRQGFDNIILMKGSQYISRKKDKGNQLLFSSALVISFMSSIILIAFFFLLKPFLYIIFDKEVMSLTYILIFTLPFFSVIWFIGENMKANNQIVTSTFLQLSIIPLFTIVISSITHPKEIESIIIYFSLNIFLLALILLILYKNMITFPSLGILYKYYKIASPYLFATLFGIIMNVTDTLMLSILSTNIEVGIYVIAFKVASLSMLIILGVNSVFSSKFSNAYKYNNLTLLYTLYKQSFFLTILPVIFLSIVVLFFSKPILIFINHDAIAAEGVLYILLCVFIFKASSSSAMNLLSMSGKGNYLRKIIFNGAIINIILNYFLIIKFGSEGAALATGITTILISLFFIKQTKIILNQKSKVY